jgi:pilus assembly protein CpaD
MWSSRLALIAAASLAALSLGGCAADAGIGDHAALTPTERFSIQVTPRPHEVRLVLHDEGLSPNQVAALTDFAHEWLRAEGGVITLQSPQEGDDPAAYRTTEGARRLLMSEGVRPENLRVVGYRPRGDDAATVIVGYMTYVAEGPNCSEAWGNLSASANNNAGNANFGCAVTANVAASLANPGDLVEPRAETPTDAARRSVVLGHYRNGEVTTSARDDQASGAVSHAVN